MLTIYANIFQRFWEWLDGVVAELNFDGLLQQFLDEFVFGLPEIFKWLLAILLSVIIVLGTISFIKKTLKLFIVLAIIAIVILILYKR